MNIITLDWETYYTNEYSLSKVTTEQYVRSPLFEAIGVATKVNDGPIEWFSGSHAQIKKHLQKLPWGNHLLLAQNTAFDAAILNWQFGIKPAGYLDTMSMAHALHGISQSSSLANLARLYEEVEKGNAVVAALGKHRADFTPEELAEYGDYCIHDTELCYNIFHKMMKAFPKAELRVIDLTIRMFAEPMLVLDKKMLQEDLYAIQLAKRTSLLALMNLLGVKNEDTMKEQLMSNPKLAELLLHYGVEPPTKISLKTGKEAFAFAKTDEEFVALGESDDPIIATIVATRLGHKSTIAESRTEAFIGIAERGKMPFPLTYSGARVTQRWSGFDQINAQNMPRGSVLRNAIMAPPGYTFVVGDLSNIELRVGMWIAGQDDAVEQLRAGLDLYRIFAVDAFGLVYEEIGKSSVERFIAKTAVLSMIYGVGAPKLRDSIRVLSKGKTVITLEEAERLKTLYRTKNACVVDAWKEGGRVLDWLVHGEEHTAWGFLPVRTGRGIVKPNGLCLPFPGLTASEGEKGVQYEYKVKKGKNDVATKAYGGKVFQRTTQSLSRDIMAGHAVELASRCHLVGLVHDEAICLVPDEEVEEAKAFMAKVMRTPPAWGLDIPLDCEIYWGKRYGTAK